MSEVTLPGSTVSKWSGLDPNSFVLFPSSAQHPVPLCGPRVHPNLLFLVPWLWALLILPGRNGAPVPVSPAPKVSSEPGTQRMCSYRMVPHSMCYGQLCGVCAPPHPDCLQSPSGVYEPWQAGAWVALTLCSKVQHTSDWQKVYKGVGRKSGGALSTHP